MELFCVGYSKYMFLAGGQEHIGIVAVEAVPDRDPVDRLPGEVRRKAKLYLHAPGVCGLVSTP